MKAKKSNVPNQDKYIADSYTKSYIYLNTDENAMTEVFYVNKSSNLVLFIGSLYSDIELFEVEDETEETEETKQQTGLVTEDFALKMIAITLNQEKYKEL